jgi:dTDP-4-amino-4,6-dideoxygalactose transaminase
MNQIPFNKPFLNGDELQYLDKVIATNKFCGDGLFTKKCNQQLREITSCKNILMTTSCTHALEMSAILCDIHPGDEVIMSSFTFVSTANAFVLRGAKIIFVDIKSEDMNINENLIQAAITSKTKIIVVMHYAGVACNMNKILEIASQYKLKVIEDAAQCIDSYYYGRHLGTLGDLGSLSFHETKNIHCGEGGAIIINNSTLIEKAEIIREKGTDRTKFLEGIIDKYSWVEIGSSYLPSELNCAFLYTQLNNLKKVTNKRLALWRHYHNRLKNLYDIGKIGLQIIPEYASHNGHIFFIKCFDSNERKKLINFLYINGISSVFHYIPLHTSPAGFRFGNFHSTDNVTTKESEKILRLPLYFEMELKEIDIIVDLIIKFYSK